MRQMITVGTRAAARRKTVVLEIRRLQSAGGFVIEARLFSDGVRREAVSIHWQFIGRQVTPARDGGILSARTGSKPP
jgi:hypothetical protein